ncbi:Transcriptional regulator, AsnC family [Sulfitobacter noctilucicola]|uniref:DNA-binding Lrp family transcriptional regulator n=1 Tax=Sulfitobacter noctilucicola TaxID=1342301 RepID=A0A7W6MB38_9RHOB|nr:Lrp/AsnC family transcriptional regulator [Sulfitobacter noctilucicola]KIN66440.1 Transcriptional regulator, AsnC family [Sulfitobacter noctilucicola]MBB4175785.1 DNA-binding Lrp family transcriptional regulator [Sulfitobacter noctilucicola]
MDDLDMRIVAALRHDARMPLSELAATLKTSRTTVRARLQRLQNSGEIAGFSVLTRADVMRDPVRGLMMIGIEGRGADRITRQLSGYPEVRAVHSTNGRWDIIVEIGAETLERFDDVLTRIRRLDGITSSETNLLLKTSKAR